MSVWNNEDLMTALQAAVEEGLTAMQISRKLNHDFGLSLTRNAIIGKVHRAKLAFKNEPCSKKPRHDPQATPKPRPVRRVRLKLICDAAEPTPRGDVDDGCRWLHGEAAARNFCGAPKRLLSSWCPHHEARVVAVAPLVRVAA